MTTSAPYTIVPEEHLGTPDQRGYRCLFHYAIRSSGGGLVYRTEKLDTAQLLVAAMRKKPRAAA